MAINWPKHFLLYLQMSLSGTASSTDTRYGHQVRKCTRKNVFHRHHQAMCWNECCKFEFHLEGIYNSAEDCNITYETYTASNPQSWEAFFNILFPHQAKSVNIQCKFQIIHYVIRNGKKQNSFPVGLAEFFRGDSKAKLVSEILNKIGLCTSYDELQRIDFGLMKLVIKTTGTNRVPVLLTIDWPSIKNTRSWRNG